MADQYYDAARNRFFLDLHGVMKRDAARVIRKRLEECSRYGIAVLEVVYGTPDLFDGSVASVLHEVVTGSPLVETGNLPREFVQDCANYAFRIARIDIPLLSLCAPAQQDESLVFAPFAASREPDIWLRRRCENSFRPFQSSFSREETARITGRGCRPQDIPHQSFSLEQLEDFCRAWEPPLAEQSAPPEAEQAPMPPAQSPEERIEQEWNQLWSDADELRKGKDFRASEAKLQRCMDLAAQFPNGLLLARTLGALAIVSAAKQNRDQSEAYRASANAVYETQTGPARWESLEFASRLVDDLVEHGRLSDAVDLLAGERARLEQEAHPFSPAVIYVFQTEASLRLRLADHARATHLFERALQTAESDPEISYAATASLRLQLGLLASGRAALRPALAYLTQAAEEFELAPEASPLQRFLCLREVAAVADQLGYEARSQEILRDLTAMTMPPGSMLELARVEAMIDLGNLYFRQQLWAEAERRYLQAGESLGDSLPADTQFTIHENLGHIYTTTGRLAEAEKRFLQASDISRHVPGFGSLRFAHLRLVTGELYERLGREPEARSAYEEALRIYAREGAENPDSAETHFRIGLLLARAGDLDEAEYHLRLALSIKEQVFGEGRPTTADNLVKLGHILAARGALTQARPMLANGIRILEEHRMYPALLAEAYAGIAVVQKTLGQIREAKKSEEKAQFYAYAVRSSNREVSKLVN